LQDALAALKDKFRATCTLLVTEVQVYGLFVQAGSQASNCITGCKLYLAPHRTGA